MRSTFARWLPSTILAVLPFTLSATTQTEAELLTVVIPAANSCNCVSEVYIPTAVGGKLQEITGPQGTQPIRISATVGAERNGPCEFAHERCFDIEDSKCTAEVDVIGEFPRARPALPGVWVATNDDYRGATYITGTEFYAADFSEQCRTWDRGTDRWRIEFYERDPANGGGQTWLGSYTVYFTCYACERSEEGGR